jgi:hypothetical protein
MTLQYLHQPFPYSAIIAQPFQSNEHCSCDDLQDVSDPLYALIAINLTQMEVVMLCISQDNKSRNNMNDRCPKYPISIYPRSNIQINNRKFTYVQLKRSFQSIEPGICVEDLWASPPEQSLEGASHRSLLPVSCEQHLVQHQCPFNISPNPAMSILEGC